MGILGPDERGLRHEINVNVTSLQAWSDELHRLTELTQPAAITTNHWAFKTFTGAGPPGAAQLRALNDDSLATLVAALEQLDDLIARLRDAATQVAASYNETDAYAQASTDAVRAGMIGQQQEVTGNG